MDPSQWRSLMRSGESVEGFIQRILDGGLICEQEITRLQDENAELKQQLRAAADTKPPVLDRWPTTGSPALLGHFPMGELNPVERQKKIKLDQLQLNIGKSLEQLNTVRQQSSAAKRLLQQENADLAATKTAALQAAQELQAKQQEVRTTADSLTKLQQQVAAETKTLGRLDADIAAAKEQLAAARSSKKKLEKAHASLQAGVTSAEQYQVRLQADITAAEQDKAALQEKIEAAQDQKRTLQELIAGLGEDRDIVQASVEDAEQQLKQLQEDAQQAQQELIQTRIELEQLRGQCTAAESKLAELLANHEKLLMDMNDAQHKKSQVDAAAGAAAQQLEQTQQELAELQVRLEARQAELDAAEQQQLQPLLKIEQGLEHQEEVFQLKQQVLELQKAATAAVTSRAEAYREKEALQAEQQQLQQQLGTVQASNDCLQEEMQQLKADLEAAQAAAAQGQQHNEADDAGSEDGGTEVMPAGPVMPAVDQLQGGGALQTTCKAGLDTLAGAPAARSAPSKQTSLSAQSQGAAARTGPATAASGGTQRRAPSMSGPAASKGASRGTTSAGRRAKAISAAGVDSGPAAAAAAAAALGSAGPKTRSQTSKGNDTSHRSRDTDSGTSLVTDSRSNSRAVGSKRGQHQRESLERIPEDAHLEVSSAASKRPKNAASTARAWKG